VENSTLYGHIGGGPELGSGCNIDNGKEAACKERNGARNHSGGRRREEAKFIARSLVFG
jgi:hypothetical protein